MRIVNPTAKRGEDLACEYLLTKGYKVIERNFRKGYGELDIVAVKSNTLVFIEVKTRRSTKFGSPLESITSWKLHNLIRTAQFFAMTHRGLPDGNRIDAIAITLDYNGNLISLDHTMNITQ